MKKYSTLIILLLISLLSVVLFFYKLNSSPPCLNADEAAFGYNAYSILKTGRDEYGALLPLRLKSFGDYKLPLISYLTIPWISLFGLNEFSIHLVNLPFVFLFPIAIYFLAQELFNKKRVSLLAAFLIAVTPGIQTIGRQVHEAYLTTFFLTLVSLFFMKLIKKQTFVNYLLFFISLLISLFGYHFSRLWAGFYFMVFLFFVFKKKLKTIGLVIFIVILLGFELTDIVYSPARIKNLLFFNNIGFSLKIAELRGEGGSRAIYNKLTIGAKDLTNEYLKYFSPQFLLITGDENLRFGFPGISLITPVEYLLIFIGLYFLFKNKEKWRYLILFMLLFSPISGSLSWAGTSLTRSIFIFIPILLIVSYGTINLLNKKEYYFYFLLSIVYLLFLFYSWDFYFNHYPKRAIVIRAFQCGYKELSNYINNNYSQFDKFYITPKNGQPYIFLLFYLKYPPGIYQKQASLSAPDEYGFGQVESFDKYVFALPGKPVRNSVIIGYPDDFNDQEKSNLKEIKVGTETIFLIKEVK